MVTFIKNRTKGFTLIELLVVIAIISILSSVVLASLGTARQKARDATRVSDLKNLQLALELYFDGAQSYPINLAANALPTAALVPTYIPVAPVAPAGTTAYFYKGITSSTVFADTCAAGACQSYGLYEGMERVDSLVLQKDTDILTTGGATGPNIDGTSVACTAAAGVAATAVTVAGGTATERCYSLHP